MDIFEYALKMEKDGENFYRDIAQKTSDKGLKKIVTMLADEEVKHYRAVEKMKQDEYHMTDTTVLDNAKNIFIAMKEKNEGFEPNQQQTELYRQAQEIEKKSEQFYRDKAGQTENDDRKNLFERLAGEEKKHYFLLDNIIEFVSRPKLWLENAEWYHLEEY